jgi:fatty acid desaturase
MSSDTTAHPLPANRLDSRRRTAADAATNLYTELAHAVRGSGLLKRRYAWYWWRLAVACVAFGLVWSAVVWLGDSWLQVLPAIALGVLMTQFGFLGHDAAHRQMFASARWNDATARLCATAFAGLSLNWWRSKHNRHHAAPNQVDRDPDIAPGAIAFTPEIATRRTGAAGWVACHQGWLFFPLLVFEGLNLHVASVRPLWGVATPRRERVESVLVLARLTAYILVLCLVLPVDKAAVFVAVQSAVFGVCLGGSFAPNHKGMPIVPRTARIDFLRRQVLMSRNVRGGWIVDFALGGLNYQIEHHLFPSMPRPNLRLVQPLVRDYCASHGVSYAEVGLFESYGIVVDYLNNVGLRARGPFDCPILVQYRD